MFLGDRINFKLNFILMVVGQSNKCFNQLILRLKTMIMV